MKHIYLYIYNYYTAEYNLLYKNFKKYLEFLKNFSSRLKTLYHIFRFCQDFKDIINTIVTFFAAFFLLLDYIFPIVTEKEPMDPLCSSYKKFLQRFGKRAYGVTAEEPIETLRGYSLRAYRGLTKQMNM